jgi:hypothetical protein
MAKIHKPDKRRETGKVHDSDEQNSDRRRPGRHTGIPAGHYSNTDEHPLLDRSAVLVIKRKN